MSISVEKACEIVFSSKEIAGTFKIDEIVDIGNAYAFCLERKDGEILPGDCPITVDKNSGKVDLLTIPPIENLDMLVNGKGVAIPEKYKAS